MQRREYDAWGVLTADTGGVFQSLGYAGGLTDTATRLVRFGARDYDPEVGRWTTKDPIGFAGGDANLYAYAGNVPSSMVDPTGAAASKPKYPPWPEGGLPPSAAIDNNICQGRKIGSSFGNGPGATVERAAYFISLVGPLGGAFDFRANRYSGLSPAARSRVGNANYGAIGSAIGYSDVVLLAAGGFVDVGQTALDVVRATLGGRHGDADTELNKTRTLLLDDAEDASAIAAGIGRSRACECP